MSDTSHRLPGDVYPRRYDLRLAPELHTARFGGEVTIEVEVTAPTSSITLHSLDLRITDAQVTCSDRTQQADVELDPDREMALLTVAQELEPGPARLHLAFDGELNDQLVGFYRSTFTAPGPDGADVDHTMVVTQFESTHARRAFPCFDEPAMKAVFSVTLDVDDSLLVVANTAEVDRAALGDGRVRVSFADTIPMSTYLVAFVVGPLEATAVRMVEGISGPIPLRVVHPPGSAHLCDFALDVAAAALEFFEGYYELPYPGDKVDLVAVPDFAFGAMENLGCITFREVLLLVDPARSTQPELQRVADVINHELAHMWFGDLVTMSWWNGIWLNEAFATFMEVTATDSFRPEWDVWTTFGLARAAAFDTDTLDSTRPIEYEVVTASDAEGMFDILTYEKGASVVRMLEQYLGAERFRRGIVAYLRRHAYANTDTGDLWDAIEDVTGEPVRRIMDSWILRGGHPVVRASSSGGNLLVAQHRARFDGGAPGRGMAHETDTSIVEDEPWPVPMVIAIGTGDGERTERHLLLEDPVELVLSSAAEHVQVNVGGAGFYRVELDPTLRIGLLDHGSPAPLERFVLVDDTWAGMLAGRVPASEVVDLLRRAARDEPDPSVWRRLASALRELARLAGPGHSAGAQALVRELALPALAPLESATELDERLQDLRGVLFTLAGVDGADPAVRNRARKLWDSTDDAALRAAATSVIAASATPAEHAEMERRWREATTPQEELRRLYALVDTDLPQLFDHALDLAVTEVRSQNAPYLLRRALDHPTLGAAAWRTIQSRWAEVVDRFPSNSLPRMLEGIRLITDADTAEQVRVFLGGRDELATSMQVTQHIERMWVTVSAAQRVRAELERSPGILGHASS